jgi:hypothetical protein
LTFLEDTVSSQLKKVTIDIEANEVNEELMISLFDLVDERGKVSLGFRIKNNDKTIKATSQRYKLQMDETTKKKMDDLGLKFRFN